MVTGTWEQTPRGIEYARRHVEYQEFPEEYFSGADVVIYFGDTFIDDITGLQFTLTEQVRPIYGYASYTWDTVARGIRLINGSFRVAFREAGYLFAILERLGQTADKAAPALGKMLAGEKPAVWQAEAMQTIGEILGRRTAPARADYILIRPQEYDIPPQDTAIIWARDLGSKLNLVAHWDNNRRVVVMGGIEFKPHVIEDKRAYLLLRPACEALGYRVHWDAITQNIAVIRKEQTVATVFKGEYRLIRLPGNQAVMPARDLGQRLGLAVDRNEGRGTIVIGGKEFRPQQVVGDKVYVPIREVAETHGYSVHWDEQTREIIITPRGGGVISRDRYKTVPGQDRAVVRAEFMRSILNAEQQFKVASDGVYYFGRRFERVDGVYDGPGVYAREVLENLGYSVHWRKDTGMIIYVPAGSVFQTQGGAVPKAVSDYEAEVWADSMVPERGKHRHFRPYFYGSDNQASLRESGFDIYIVYGPLPHHVKQRLNVLPDYISYNTTVKAIRNVQLLACTQALDPTGRPIEEEYTFIARDKD